MSQPNSIFRLFAAFVVSISLFAASASAQCEGSKPMTKNDECAASKDLVATAIGAENFQTLVTAVKSAGLVEALQGDGPFTIFAPTDAAFAKLPKGTVASLLEPENRGKLTEILTYHVIPGKLTAKEVVARSGATTLLGQRLAFSASDAGVTVGGVSISKTDVYASNGVIHVIDGVLMPQTQNIAEVAQSAGTFGTLIAAATAAGLVPALTGDGPLTVFAPTDDAFAALPKGTVASLLEPENLGTLQAILKLHVVQGRVYSPDAVRLGKATALSGGSLEIAQKNGAVTVNGAKVTAADLDASNGVIHVIDQVILP